MATHTMTATFLGGAATSVAERQPSINGRRLMVVKAAGAEGQDVDHNSKGSSNSRRAVVLAVAAAAISAVRTGQGIAVAGEVDLKRGTPEARKAYAPVCVTMPTARICHK